MTRNDDKLLEKIDKMSNSHPELRVEGGKPKDDVEGTHEKLSTTTRECEFCGKKFSSGKALGGHKRFHLQAQRKGKEANNSNGNGIIKLSPNNLILSGKFSCSICRNDFPSNKSLYGHMRSHSDRNWKGIHSPLFSSLLNHRHSSHSDSSMDENKVKVVSNQMKSLLLIHQYICKCNQDGIIPITKMGNAFTVKKIM